MMSKAVISKKIAKVLLLLLAFFLFSSRVKPVYAQVFKFDTSSLTQPQAVGGSFTVDILINTAGQEVINGDALINFDPALVRINSADNGDFMTYFAATPLGGTNDKYLISSWEESVAHAKSSSADTLFATVNMTSLKEGAASFSFECADGTEADSNINRSSDASDIINCSSLSPLALNIGGSGSSGSGSSSPTPTQAVYPTATNTPFPTATQQPTATKTPTPTQAASVSQLPRSGMVEVTLGAIGLGLLLTTVGVLFIL